MTTPRNKLLFHLVICILTWLIFIKPLIQFMEGFAPFGKAISEISLTDLYFSKFVKSKPSNDIYIIDIGELSGEKVRQYVSNFLEEINIKHPPRAIGLDIYFDRRFSDPVYDSILKVQISKDNIVRACRLDEVDGVVYIDRSDLDLSCDFDNSDGYTNSLGDATNHPCVRDYLPQKLIRDIRYNDFSLLVAKKAYPKIYNQYYNDIDPLSKKGINYNVNFNNHIIDISDTLRYSELKDKIVLIGTCTYNRNGVPKFTDDTWFTPLNELYVGRSQKDMYGVEIKATIISNIINEEHLVYNAKTSRAVNLIISLIIYYTLLNLFLKIRSSFVFVKVFSQTIGALALAILNVIVIHLFAFHIDLTVAVGVMFFAPEIVELIEEISDKYKLHEVILKLKSRVNSFLISFKNK